jgi:PEGA domain
MLARRVIAISPDKALAKQLGTALKAAGGAVEVHQTLDALGKGELQAALVVVHVDGELAGALEAIAPRLAGDARLVVVIPRHDLIKLVDVMRVSERVAGVLIAEGLDLHDLASTATRILAGDIFGMEKLVPWGTKVYSTLVGDYQEKSLCIAQMSEFAELMGVRRKYREAIEQCVDEMLMNALYDAPVDDQGRQIFAEIPTKTRISLRMEQKVVVQYGCDGKRFMVSVRDSFGTIERATVLKYLYKCLHSEQQIDRKTGGAGLGLYLMANSSTRFLFNVLPGVATECVCVFDLEAPKLQLDNFGFFLEKIDAAGRLAAGPSRLLPAGASFPVERRRQAPPAPARTPRGMVAALSAAIVLMLVLIGLVAYPRFMKPETATLRVETDPVGAAVEVDGKLRGFATSGVVTVDDLEIGRAYRVTATKEGFARADTVVQPTAGGGAVTLHLEPHSATVTIDSDPPGAQVLVDNQDVGRTPVTVSTLRPLTEVELVLRKTGYLEVHRKLKVPGPGAESQISQSLNVSPDFATIVVASTPLGADVYLDGQRLPGVTTPTDEILVEAGRAHKVSLRLPRYVPAELTTSPPHGARRISVGATLSAGAEVHVEANVEGRATVEGVEACTKKPLPLDCPLKQGNYTVKVEGTKPPGSAQRKITVDTEAVAVVVQFGFVEAPTGKKIVVGGQHVTRAAYEEGRRVVTVLDEESAATSPVEVQIVAGRTAKVE